MSRIAKVISRIGRGVFRVDERPTYDRKKAVNRGFWRRLKTR